MLATCKKTTYKYGLLSKTVYSYDLTVPEERKHETEEHGRSVWLDP